MNIPTSAGIKLSVVLTVFSALASANLWAQCPTNVNLIANGDAEAQQSITGNTNQDVSSWDSQTGAFTVVRYGEAGGFPTIADPGPANRGNYFFSGGPSSALATATQTVDVSACSALIDTGNLTYNVSGYFGGRVGQNDRTRLDLQFFNGSNIQIGLATIGPVTAADRGSTTGLLSRALNGAIPIATRSIVFVLFMIPQAGDNDGYADNLNFTILGPTAADLTVGGRVSDRYGRAISQAAVSLTDFNGISRRAITNTFGYFNFTGAEAGQTYVFSVTHRRYSFSPQVINLSDSVSNLLFVAN